MGTPEANLSVETIRTYLNDLRDICANTPVIDCHVHATEVIRDEIRYGESQCGLFSTGVSHEYKSPTIAAARLGAGEIAIKPERQNRLSEMAFTRTYQHTGTPVLLDAMDLAGVDCAVLLPVAHSEASLQRQMEVIDSCCTSTDRLIAGYSIPESVPSAEFDVVLKEAVSQSNVRVVKVHGNVCGIDLASEKGATRLHQILAACSNSRLPVLVHGGCSPILGARPESKFSTIEKLAYIDWSASDSPVIIAHFGVYGCGEAHDGISAEEVRIAQKILDRHPNVFFDTSGVGFTTIHHFLQRVEPGRLIFGSDAMYVPMYRQVAYIMHAFEILDLDKELLRVLVSENALNIFSGAFRS